MSKTHSLLISLICLGVFAPARAAEKKNIVFFLSDDHRADFLGCAGHPILKTPHIDALAKHGVRFENAFVTTSICAASRASILTGRYERTHKYTFRMPPIDGKFIKDSYPVMLKKTGYRTGFVGKFGVGVLQGHRKSMFDSFVPLGRNPYFKKRPGGKRHLTDITGDKAIEFLKSCKKDEPFCLSVSFNAAHAEDSDKKNHFPWPPTENGLYEEATIPPPRVDINHWKKLPKFFHKCMHRDRWFWRWDTPEKYQKNVKAYYRMLTGLDRNIGRVVAQLEELGLKDNTVIVFCGDNGYYKGSRGFAGKWSHFEESLRVPMVIYDPSLPVAKRGRVIPQISLNIDLAATFIDYSGTKIPAGYQGKSLRPLVAGEKPNGWRTDFFCEHLMQHPPIPKYEGVRTEQYKYARYFEHMPEGEFLHDLHADPKELKNLVGNPKYKDLLNKLRKRCDELRDAYGGKFSKEKFKVRGRRF